MTSTSIRAAVVITAVLFLRLALTPLAATEPPAGDVELGKRIYEQGIGHDGQPVKALGQGDIEVFGSDFACTRCHRRSGFGASEGGYYIPSIAATYLFEPRRIQRSDRYRALFIDPQSARQSAYVRSPRIRPAYTMETLHTALATGLDPGDNRFQDLMPRYDLDQQDMANLYAYLQTLSAEISPGVDDTHIHYAIVIGPDVPAERSEAVLATMDAFVVWMNERIGGDQRMNQFFPYDGADVREWLRKLKLHEWRLSGAPSTWRAQLEAKQAEQPAFALVNGLVAGSWEPVAQFCNENAVPCMLPITDFPAVNDVEGQYTVYYDRGLYLEAELMLDYLSTPPPSTRHNVLVWHAQGNRGEIPAAYFRELLREHDQIKLSKLQQYPGGDDLAAFVSANLERIRAADTLVIWPDADASALLQALTAHDLGDVRLLLPQAAAGSAQMLLNSALADQVYFTYPRALASGYYPETYRIQGWMNSRGLEVTDQRLHFKAHYGMMIVFDAMRHIFNNFHRDYFLELIEHEVEGSKNPGLYPRLSLGPDQRYLSKGGYIVKPADQQPDYIAAVTDWIIP
ncbi:MAG: hypothetical protein KKC01_02370 [Gammaproteobacteria bacterium]|nr:hypothetical protein [Gammaproteobacteria bacterium]